MGYAPPVNPNMRFTSGKGVTYVQPGQPGYNPANNPGQRPAPAPTTPAAPAASGGPDGNYWYGGSKENSDKILNDIYGNALQSAFHPAAAPQAQVVRPNMTPGGLAALAGAQRLGQASDLYAPQQQALADELRGVAAGTAGPSVAELAMRRQAAQAANQNLAIAAGGTGPGANAALINATNRNAMSQGQLVQDLGLQRAVEQQQARGALADLLAQSRGQTAAEGGAYGQLSQVAGQQAIAAGGLEAQQNVENAKLQGIQNALNQGQQQFYYGNWLNATQGQTGLTGQGERDKMNFITGQQANAERAREFDASRSDSYLGAALSTLGTIGAAGLTAFTGGAAAPLAAAAVANTANQYSKLSDIRAKTRIAPAGPQISGAYRGIANANDQAQQIKGADVAYPSPFAPASSASYYYKDPSAPGAEPGQHFGPMAQELEQTPAGRSVVTTMPNGTKGIDTGRLALLNASETGQLRREVDALKVGKPKVPTARFPDLAYADKAAALKKKNDEQEAMLRQLTAAGDVSAFNTPTQYALPRQPVAFTGY